MINTKARKTRKNHRKILTKIASTNKELENEIRRKLFVKGEVFFICVVKSDSKAISCILLTAQFTWLFIYLCI